MNKNVSVKTISQASCTLNITPVPISTTVTITTAGAGYAVAPNITFVGGGGSGAAATATINGSGAITAVTVTSAGTGYTSIPTIVVSVAGNANGTFTAPTTTAVLTAALSAFTIASVTLDNPGSGYLTATPPTVTIAGYTGTTAPTVTAIVNTAGFVTGFTFTAGVALTVKGTATIAVPIVPAVAINGLFGSVVRIPNVGAGEIDVTGITLVIAGNATHIPAATTYLDVFLLDSNFATAVAPYTLITAALASGSTDLDRIMSANHIVAGNTEVVASGLQFGQLNKTGAAVKIPIKTLPGGDIWVAVVVRGLASVGGNITFAEIILGTEIKK